MLDILLTVNNFLHDFASGLWLATLLVLYLLFKYISQISDEAAKESLRGVFETVFILTLVSLGAIIITGVPRLLTYNYYIQRGSQAPPGFFSRENLLIGKHILLFVVYGIGTWWAFRLKNRSLMA